MENGDEKGRMGKRRGERFGMRGEIGYERGRLGMRGVDWV